MAAAEESTATVYAALLRGVNLGPRAKVAMAELRELLTELGHQDVRTHLNSGNAVFRARPADEAVLEAELEEAIERRFGFPVSCLVRGGDYLRAVAETNPFAEQAVDGTRVHATFLGGPVDAGLVASVLPPDRFRPDEYRPGDRVIYLHLPNGLGRSKLAEILSRPAGLTGVTATTRNWNTVVRLVQLTAAS